jgi:hypothetical protein
MILNQYAKREKGESCLPALGNENKGERETAGQPS